MEVNSVVKNLIGIANSKAQSQTSKLSLQDKNMSVG
jgi:predicted metalloprotease